jgi:hypothetical protein
LVCRFLHQTAADGLALNGLGESRSLSSRKKECNAPRLDCSDLKPTLPSDVVYSWEEEVTMKSLVGVALIATATLLGGAAITTGSSQPASAAGVENSRATTATDFSARRRYRRVVRYRYVPRYYVQQRYYYSSPYYSSPYSSYGYGLHSGYHHDWHSGYHFGPHDQFHYDPYHGWHSGEHFGPHSGEHHDWHGGLHDD